MWGQPLGKRRATKGTEVEKRDRTNHSEKKVLGKELALLLVYEIFCNPYSRYRINFIGGHKL